MEIPRVGPDAPGELAIFHLTTERTWTWHSTCA